MVPKPREIINSFPINKPTEMVWQAVIETFAELNLPIMNMEKDSGLITTDWMLTNKIYCDCESPGLTLAQREFRGKFNVFLKKISNDLSEMKVNCLYEMIIFYTGSVGPRTYSCVSTGKLEAEIYRLVDEKLR